MDEATIFGVLCFGSAYINASKDAAKANDFFRQLGKRAWELWGHGKDKTGTAFKNMTKATVFDILVKLGGHIPPFPAFTSGQRPAEEAQTSAEPKPQFQEKTAQTLKPGEQHQAESAPTKSQSPLVANAKHAGFDQKA